MRPARLLQRESSARAHNHLEERWVITETSEPECVATTNVSIIEETEENGDSHIDSGVIFSSAFGWWISVLNFHSRIVSVRLQVRQGTMVE